MLPTSMLAPSTTQADDDGAYVDGESGEPDELTKEESSLAGVEQPSVKYDSAVAPATAEEPIEEAEADPSVGDVVTAAPATPPPTLADPPAKPQTWPTTPIVGDLRGVKLFFGGRPGQMVLEDGKIVDQEAVQVLQRRAEIRWSRMLR